MEVCVVVAGMILTASDNNLRTGIPVLLRTGQADTAGTSGDQYSGACVIIGNPFKHNYLSSHSLCCA